MVLATGVLGSIGGSLSGFGLGRATQPPFWFPFLVYALVLLGVAELASGYGLYAFEPWAPRLARTVWAVSVLVVLVLMFGIETTRTSVLLGLLELATIAIVVYYLSTPEVRALY